MQRDATLEALSEKVRKGEALGLLETIAVLDYQERLMRRERLPVSFMRRLWSLIAR